MWYGIVDTVLYIGRMSILVSQGAVARAYRCLLKGLGLSSLGRSLDSYCWDTNRHYEPIVSDGDVKNRFTWIALIHVVEIRTGTATKLLYPKVRDSFPRIAKFLFLLQCIVLWLSYSVEIVTPWMQNHIQIFAVSKEWTQIIFAFVNICRHELFHGQALICGRVNIGRRQKLGATQMTNSPCAIQIWNWIGKLEIGLCWCIIWGKILALEIGTRIKTRASTVAVNQNFCNESLNCKLKKDWVGRKIKSQTCQVWDVSELKRRSGKRGEATPLTNVFGLEDRPSLSTPVCHYQPPVHFYKVDIFLTCTSAHVFDTLGMPLSSLQIPAPWCLSKFLLPRKGLVPFTHLVKVRRVTWFWHFQASDFQETFTR